MNLGLALKVNIAGWLISIILVASASSYSYALSAIGEANAEYYVLVTKWGSPGSTNGRFSGVGGIGVDTLGHKQSSRD